MVRSIDDRVQAITESPKNARGELFFAFARTRGACTKISTRLAPFERLAKRASRGVHHSARKWCTRACLLNWRRAGGARTLNACARNFSSIVSQCALGARNALPLATSIELFCARSLARTRKRANGKTLCDQSYNILHFPPAKTTTPLLFRLLLLLLPSLAFTFSPLVGNPLNSE